MAADKVLLPGVGDASVALSSLRSLGLDSVIPSLKCPVLGIFGTDVVRFRSDDPSVKIPHMGWNSLTGLESPLFKGLREGSFMYFVHSFYADCPEEFVTSTAEYGFDVTASVQRDNVYGCQFHPEKSSEAGLSILRQFCAIAGGKES